MKSTSAAREVITGLFIGLTVAAIAIGIGGPMIVGSAPLPSLLLAAVVWIGGSLFLALVKVIVS